MGAGYCNETGANLAQISTDEKNGDTIKCTIGNLIQMTALSNPVIVPAACAEGAGYPVPSLFITVVESIFCRKVSFLYSPCKVFL